VPTDGARAPFRRYVAVWQSGDLAAVDAILHHAHVGHAAQGGRDRAGLEDRIGAFRQRYAEQRFTVGNQLAEGDRVASRMRSPARLATGERVVLHGLNISRIADGRIAEEWMTWESAPEA
jgi:hypothetical protein